LIITEHVLECKHELFQQQKTSKLVKAPMEGNHWYISDNPLNLGAVRIQEQMAKGQMAKFLLPKHQMFGR
jgi:hypothetical protein